MAFSLARLTLAPRTPGTFPKARSTRLTQEAQVIPVTPKFASRTSVPYPAPSIVPTRSSGLVAFGSYSTVALSAAKFTLAPETPSFLPRARSTRRTQEAHVIPVTGIMTCSNLVFSVTSDPPSLPDRRPT